MGMDVSAYISFGVLLDDENIPQAFKDKEYGEEDSEYESWIDEMYETEGFEVVWAGSYEDNAIILTFPGFTFGADWYDPVEIPKGSLFVSHIKFQEFDQKLQDLGITQKPKWYLSAMYSH